MGFLTGLFCVICSIAIIKGGKPFSMPTLRDLFQIQSYNHVAQESPTSDESNSIVPDDIIYDQSTYQKDGDSHSMILPLETNGNQQLTNEWRQSKILSVKRDFLDDRLNEAHQQQRPFTASCDVCRTDFKLFDLGYTHFPRFLVRAVCQGNSRQCRRGTKCKEVPYKVRVLTYRNATDAVNDNELPDVLNSLYKFKTVTVAVSCQCSD